MKNSANGKEKNSLRAQLSLSLAYPQEEEGRRVQASCRIPASFPGFEGHFPGNPLLPAFCILQLAVLLAEHALGFSVKVRSIRRSRFIAPVRPDTPFSLSETIEKEADTAVFFCSMGLSVGSKEAAAIKFSVEKRSCYASI